MKEFRAKIENIAYGGDGVARYEGKVVFIPGVIEGESIVAKTYDERKRFDKALCAEIIEASAFRTEPPCPISLRAGMNPDHQCCRGCPYQHMQYSHQLLVKKYQLEKFLIKFSEIAQFPDIQIIPSPKQFYYRNKISLSLGFDKNNNRKYLGYVSGDNRTVIEVPYCMLAKEEINEYLAKIPQEKIQELRRGDSIFLRFSQSDGIVEWNLLSGPSQKIIKEKFFENELLTPAGSFFQVNICVQDLLFNPVYSIIKEIQPENVLDIYCGVGVFAFISAKTGVKNVIGVEADKNSIKYANLNAEKLNLKAMFIAKPAEKIVPKLLPELPIRNSMVIVDPPRCGLHTLMLETLYNASPEYLLYISCGPDTLARDLKKLKEKFSIQKIILSDMFPNTKHFETIVLLKKIN